jgi:4-amino-4-deoxy-L-arabinose transferase-like glycosyltransferase
MTNTAETGLRPSRTTTLLLLALIILIGAFFRFYQLNTLPPGDSYDPAYYGLDALRMRSGDFPIYLGDNFGREPMFSYLVAAAFAFVGVGTFGIHLASAVISLLTLPAVFLAANEFFKRDKETLLAQFGGLLAALVLALSFWHLAWSRYSVRAILIPLFISLLCFFFLRALRTQQRRYFVLAGLVMGVSLYTYQLAQVFPVLIALGFAYDLIARRSLSKKDGINFILLYGVALLIALPLIFYAVQNPGVFNQRVSNVFVLRDATDLPEQIKILSQNAWRVAKMYTVEGDTNLQINIPKRPSFNLFFSLSLIVGLGFALYRWRRPQYLFLLTWFALMSAPAFLADDAALSKRALGALPAATILIALALLLPLDWLMRRQSNTTSARKWPAMVYALLLIGGLLFTGINTFKDYFITWASDPGLYTAYDVGIAEMGKYMGTLPASETIYLSPSWGDHASLKLHSNDRSGVHTYDGNHCVVYPQTTPSQTTFLIMTSEEEKSMPLLQSYFPQGNIVHEESLGPDGLHYLAYQIPPNVPAEFQPQHPVFTNWNDELSLVGYDISGDEFKAGDTITVHLYFQPLADMSARYTAYLHLLGSFNPETGNPVWAQVDREPCFQSYPTFWWRDGEIIRDTFHLTLAPNLPAGEYTLTTGFYLWPDLTQLEIVESSHEHANQAVMLQSIEVIP